MNGLPSSLSVEHHLPAGGCQVLERLEVVVGEPRTTVEDQDGGAVVPGRADRPIVGPVARNLMSPFALASSIAFR